MGDKLTHLDSDGNVHMVDVGDKPVSHRQAIAETQLTLPPICHDALAAGGDTKKGNVFQVARLAGIMAAKKTSDLIPLCHQIPLHGVDVDIQLTDIGCTITATATCEGKTGVEMEALTAASVCALTIYDMLKALSHDMVITATQLRHKRGGRSGTIQR